MAKANKTVTLMLLLIAAGGGFWMLTHLWQSQQTELQYALQLPQPRALPVFQLLDHNGAPLTHEWFKGRWTLMFFGFTHCPDICPATLQILAAARAQLLAAGHGGPLPDILFISVDPERDTAASLRQYAAHFGAGVSGATGTLDELQKLTSALGIYFAKQAAEPGNDSNHYNVAHSAHVLVIGDQGKYRAVFSPPHSIDAFVTDMPLLMQTDAESMPQIALTPAT